MKEIRIRRSEIERYRLRPGDVVLTEGGDFDKLGRGFIWRGEPEGCDHYHHCWNPVAEGECAELRGVAAELAKETEKLMARFPNARVNADEQRQLRAALYRPLLTIARDERAKIVELVVEIVTR